jgi:hypothetical protein
MVSFTDRDPERERAYEGEELIISACHLGACRVAGGIAKSREERGPKLGRE